MNPWEAFNTRSPLWGCMVSPAAKIVERTFMDAKEALRRWQEIAERRRSGTAEVDYVVLRNGADEIERLRAIVGRLRTTDDGVPICIGDDIWSNNESGAFQWVATDLSITGVSGEFHGEHVIFEPYDKCYSTREAAEKARTT